MAADQVLEFDVVTLDGSIQKVNECTNTDLWWALRGGGGGTFAVITSVTVKTYPIPKVVTGELVINKTVSEDSWWAAMSALSTAVGSLSDAGISGVSGTPPPRHSGVADCAVVLLHHRAFQPLLCHHAH